MNLLCIVSNFDIQVWSSRSHFKGRHSTFASLFLCCVCVVRCVTGTRHVASKKTKHKQQQRPCILVHDTHTTQEESADSRRRNVPGAILYCRRYKRSYVTQTYVWSKYYLDFETIPDTMEVLCCDDPAGFDGLAPPTPPPLAALASLPDSSSSATPLPSAPPSSPSPTTPSVSWNKGRLFRLRGF